MLTQLLKTLRYIALVLFSTTALADYSDVYIFGDSLSDTGNLASVTADLPFPYYMNRVTNGPVAVEIMSQKLGLSANASLHLLGIEADGNYSVAGARASGNELIDLDTQVLSFQALNGFIAPADALYVVFLGGNDIRDARAIEDKKLALARVDETVQRIKHNIESLIAIGANKFLLVNAPNVGIIPETRLIDMTYPEVNVQNHASKLSRKYRKGLAHMVEELEESSAADIIEFDLFKYFNKLVNKAEKYGFTNSTDACFYRSEFMFHIDCNDGMNVDQFIFFDEIHPTARVHELIGEAMFELVN